MLIYGHFKYIFLPLYYLKQQGIILLYVLFSYKGLRTTFQT